MPPLSDLANDLPPELQDGAAVAEPEPDDGGDEPDPDEADAAAAGEDGGEGGEEGEDEPDGGDGTGAPAADDDDNDDDYVSSLDDDEDPDEPPAAAETPAGAPKAAATDEGQYILQNLPKIKTSIIVTGANGKDQTREVEVYGWGQLRSTPGFKGFASAIEQTDFLLAANNNESKARELQGEFRQQKVKSDTEAYTIRENRAVAKDLKLLRTDGLFPKFKGVPGSAEFNASAGAKEFDRVIAFMNEQNDEAGKAANSGEAFYHISFKMAYRMLHPEQFDAKKLAANRQVTRDAARRVKGGGAGAGPEKNVQTTRVSNITDLADEFATFAGQGAGAAK